MRGERYVVSLPRSAAAEVKGIVHQASGSGASLYIEPLEFIEKNNMLESLLEEEKQEVRRILAELTAAVFEHRDALICNQNELLDLDVISAKASFAVKFRCVPPAHGGDQTLILKGGRHPLLEQRLAAEGREIVPLDLACGPALRALVISGPNAGGKTVVLKTVGLLTLMDRAGLLIPCREGTVMPDYDKVFVDIGDDQSIEKSLSTFSSHVMRLNRILTLADGNSLVLVDEIGDGTDPEEGAALAEAVLERLLGLCGRTIVTTHLRTLKGWAHVQEGVENATLEFDHERLEPLFRLRLGVPGRSWGIEMAGRLGLSADIIERARDGLGADVLRMEELLAHLERTEQAVGREREELLRKERTLGELVEKYRDKLDRFREHRDELEDEARQEALDIVTSTRREMERLVKEIRTTQAERRTIREARERLQRRQEDFARRTQRSAAVKPIDPAAVIPGAWVQIMSLGQRGKVLSVGDSPRVQVELQGGVRVETNIDDLAASSPVEEAGRPMATWSAASFEPVTGELMVRGMERGEALEAVDSYIDRAVLQGLRTVVIIHGVGRGVLRHAIYEALRGDPRVDDVHPGEPASGGDGVAVVHLK
jgi:DNA mismatch repair protein MutS2